MTTNPNDIYLWLLVLGIAAVLVIGIVVAGVILAVRRFGKKSHQTLE